MWMAQWSTVDRVGARVLGMFESVGALASFGAREMPRSVFEDRLKAALNVDRPADWTYDDSAWDLLGEQAPDA